MSTSYMGLSAAGTRVSTHADGDYVTDRDDDPIDSEMAIVFQDPYNDAQVIIGGTKEDLRRVINEVHAQLERLDQ